MSAFHPFLAALALAFTPLASLVSCQESIAGSRLFMMDAHTGAPLWESVVMSFNSLGCLDVLAEPFEAGGDPLVAAVFPNSIRAFDANTHLSNGSSRSNPTVLR